MQCVARKTLETARKTTSSEPYQQRKTLGPFQDHPNPPKGEILEKL